MKKCLVGLLSMVACVATAGADDYGRWRSPGDYRDGGNRGDYGARGRYGREPLRAGPVDAAIRDLQMVYSRSRVDNHEASHFRRAINELSEFQVRARRGDIERKRLDRAIDDLRDLARADQVHPRHRSLLAHHLREIYSLRARL